MGPTHHRPGRQSARGSQLQLHALGRGPHVVAVEAVGPAGDHSGWPSTVRLPEIAHRLFRNARQHTPGSDHRLIGCADLGQRCSFVRIEQFERNRLQIPQSAAPAARPEPAADRRRRTGAPVRGDELRRRGMTREIAQRVVSLGQTGIGIALASSARGPGSCALYLKMNGARLAEAALRADIRSAGYDARQRSDVALRIAAADAERVQLEDSSRARFSLSPRWRFSPASARIVEEKQHRRMLLHREQHVGGIFRAR